VPSPTVPDLPTTTIVVSTTPPRWKFWADAVAAALGLNVWVTLVLVPALFVGAFRTPAESLLAALPLLPLGVGLARRSPVWQLLVYPAALLLPIAWAPRIVTGNVHGRWSFLVVSASLVGYLFSVSFFSSFHDPTPPSRTRSLSSAAKPVAPRWRRRFRLYYILAALSALLPAAMLYAVNFSTPNLSSLRDRYTGRVGSMAALLNLGVLGLWMLLFSWAFVGVLKRHRTGDPELAAELSALRKSARRGTPRPVFYLWVTLALGLMGALVFLRYR
jgi:hypothetical protein